MNPSPPLVQLSQLHFGYPEQPLFRDLSWSLAPGQMYSLLGSSGSGKSTLLKLLSGRLRASAGGLFWKGRPFSEQHNDLLGSHPGIRLMDQVPDLLPMLSVQENWQRYARQLSGRAFAHYCQEAVQALRLESVFTKKVKQLSGGELQRAWLGAVLAEQKELILLDEPFSQMDFPLRQRALKFCQKWIGQSTAILVTHEPRDALSFGSQVILLGEGQIQGPLSPQEVSENPPSLVWANLSGPVNELSPGWKKVLGLEADYIRPHHLLGQENKPGIPQVEVQELRGTGQGLEARVQHPSLQEAIWIALPFGASWKPGDHLGLGIKKPSRK